MSEATPSFGSTRRLGAEGPAPALTPATPRAPEEPIAGAAPLRLEVHLESPATPAGVEPAEPAVARVVLRADPAAVRRPVLDLCFVLDASASMHRFVLTPEQRGEWQQKAEARGEVSRQQADGRTGLVWTGQTLRELERVVSTPMLSALRGIWRTLEQLQPHDRISVLAFADNWSVVYEDSGHPNPAERLAAAKSALATLGSGADTSGLGRGTRLSGALRHAVERAIAVEGPVLRRLILISDGVIEDADDCAAVFQEAIDRGVVISALGVGEDFDEEFLMRVADTGRGTYAFAAAAPDLQKALAQEMSLCTQVVGRSAELHVAPLNGSILRDVYPVAPEICQFQAVTIEGGRWRFWIGDLCGPQPGEFLCEIHPAAFPEGEVRIGAVFVRALSATGNEPFEGGAPINLLYTHERALLQATDEETARARRHLEVYLEERRGAAARARGDIEAATRHLQAATRLLRRLGSNEMAEEMEQEAEATSAGTRNLAHTKKVKAGTRKLGRGE